MKQSDSIQIVFFTGLPLVSKIILPLSSFEITLTPKLQVPPAEFLDIFSLFEMYYHIIEDEDIFIIRIVSLENGHDMFNLCKNVLTGEVSFICLSHLKLHSHIF